MTIRHPIQCLREQSVGDFEAIVIGDGVPDSLKGELLRLINQDKRFSFIDHPKHERRGEPFRHESLMRARGHIVCYLCDRDLWLPNHLEQMLELLSKSDFAHSLPLHVLPDGSYRTFPVDLGFDGYRHMMLTMNDNRIPFSCFAHTLSAYRALKEGWTTTPSEYWTDLYMFRKFFAAEKLIGSSGILPTAITFPSPPRKGWTESERLAELNMWQKRLDNETGRITFENEVLRNTVLKQREEAARLGQLASQLHKQIEKNKLNSIMRGFT